MMNAIFYLYLRIMNRFAAPVKTFVAEAEQYVDRGCEEERHGDTAKSLSSETEDPKRRADFARIAVWHYEKCAELCRRAAAEFEQVGKSQPNSLSRRNFQLQAAQIIKRAAQAESAARQLQPLQSTTEENFSISTGENNKMKNPIAITINYLSNKFASQKTSASNAAENLSISFTPETKRVAFLVNAVLLMFLSLSITSGQAKAATFTVNMDTDVVDANLSDGVCDTNLAIAGAQCTLRAAIQESNFSVAVDTIGFSNPNTTINLTIGELPISKGVNIIGGGARKTVVQRAAGAANFRIFSIILSNSTADISGITVANGFLVNDSGVGIRHGGVGSTLNLTDVTVKNNAATGGSAGGIGNNATLNITRSTISNNTGLQGGGINNNLNGIANISNSTISDNTATNVGVPNVSGIGGGIMNLETMTFNNVTVSNNTASNSGGGFFTSEQQCCSFRNTIIAANTAPSSSPDISGVVGISQGNNLIGVSDGTDGFTNGVNGDKVGTAAAPINAQLGALQDNGGQTDTRSLLAGSPAVDAGNNCVVTAACSLANPIQALTTDQRGTNFSRQLNGDNNGTTTVDIGAFEAVAATASSVTVGGRITTAGSMYVKPVGIKGVQVNVTFPNGETRMAFSGAGGYYQFTDIPAGATYIFTVSAKKYTFSQNAQVLFISENLDGINFVAN